MSELKPYIGPHPTDHTLTEYYLKSEADKVIAEKDEEIDELKESIDQLQKATDSAWSKVNAMYDELRHNKHKRCLNKAEWCEERCARYDLLQEHSGFSWRREIDFYFRWYQRWLELAEKFKETK